MVFVLGWVLVGSGAGGLVPGGIGSEDAISIRAFRRVSMEERLWLWLELMLVNSGGDGVIKIEVKKRVVGIGTPIGEREANEI